MRVTGRILVSVLLAVSAGLTTVSIGLLGVLGPLALMANRHIRHRPPLARSGEHVHERPVGPP